MKVIPPNHKVSFPRYLVFVDTESNLAKENIERYSEHTLKLGVAIYVRLDQDANTEKREVYHFKTANEFWEWISSKTLKAQTLTIYGHNLKYDAINLNTMVELSSRSYEIPYPILNHKFIMRAYKLDGKKHTYKIKLVDTANFIMMSLKEIGKRFGKDKTEIDFKKHTYEQMVTYCQNDTEIVELFVLSYIRFLVSNNLGSFKDTLASTSSSIYRHSFLEEIWSHSDRDILAMERNAYFGGRTECFFKGSLPIGKYHVFDVKSMYPFVMKFTPLPYRFIADIKSPSIIDVKSYIKSNKYLIAQCVIKTNDKFNPYPIRDTNPDKDYPYTSVLLFPNGTFEVFLHHPELVYAIEHNHIIEVKRILVYEKSILFDKFVNYFYNIKEITKDKSERELSKITMNSLYGWFAKRDYQTERLDIPIPIDGEIAHYTLKIRDDNLGYVTTCDMTSRKTYHSWFGKLYRVTADALTPVDMGNVALAGAITAYARMYLFEMLKVCGEDHRFYCDTDSIVTDEIGAKKLQKFVGKTIGKLELQMTFAYGRINCPKDYEFCTPYIHWIYIILSPKPIRSWLWTLPIQRKVRLKGVSKLSKKLDDNHYEILHFTSFKDYMRTGKHGTQIIDKNVKRVYNKGIVKSNGFIICPTMKIDHGKNVRLR